MFDDVAADLIDNLYSNPSNKNSQETFSSQSNTPKYLESLRKQ